MPVKPSTGSVPQTSDEAKPVGLVRTISSWAVRPFYLSVAIIIAMLTVTVAVWGSSMEFPIDFSKTVGRIIDDAINWATINGDWVFDVIRDVVLWVLLKTEAVLEWINWPVFILTVALVAWKVVGKKLAVFTVATLGAMGFMGYWPSAMETMSLVLTAVVICVAIGVPLGIVASRSDTAESIIKPILDLMQTIPAFVYLVPAIYFFSLGNVPAVMATFIYSVPPVIRLTNLGIRQVSPSVVEAAKSFGTTGPQLLVKVQIPMAVPTIMAGVNQTIMMILAMVVIASMVGAGGLGEDVFRALGRQEPGNSALAGLSIVVLAIIIDRITQGLARDRQKALQG
jgi:glycine betaine/proline transport system permease protein